jgi:PIN domain nuclease of toxin-antitoxin system
MRYLLDTHAFIWWDNRRSQLSPKAPALCEDLENDIYLSIVSVWKLQIKLLLGKLTLPPPLEKTIEQQIAQNGLRILPLQLNHVYSIAHLPDLHKDPFDRLLLAQVLAEGLQFITADTEIKRYPVPTIW